MKLQENEERKDAVEQIAILTKEVPVEQQMRILGYLEGFKDGVKNISTPLKQECSFKTD